MIHARRHIRKLLLLPVFLLSTACFNEDESACVEGLLICFTPENPKHDYPALVRKVDLYFYDDAANLTASFDYSREALRPGDRAAIVESIPSGTYTLVSVINDVENYRTVDKQRLETLQSYLAEEVVEERPVDFFSGIREVTVTRTTSIQEICAAIFKHNNDVRVEIVFDGYEVPQGSTLDSRIEGNNGAYDYLAGICPEDCFRTYLPYAVEKDRDDVAVAFEFTVMRLWRTSDLTLYLEEKDPLGEVTRTVELNIAGELVQVKNDHGEFLYDTDEKLSFHDEYKIEVTLGPDFVLLALTINDWSVIRGGIGV